MFHGLVVLHKEGKYAEDNAGDGKYQEWGLPAARLGQSAAQNRSQRYAQRDGHIKYAHYGAALLGGIGSADHGRSA